MGCGVLDWDEIVVDLYSKSDLVLDELFVGECESYLVDLLQIPVSRLRCCFVGWSCRVMFVGVGFVLFG